MIKRFTIFWFNIEMYVIIILSAYGLTELLTTIFNSWHILLFTIPVCFIQGYMLGHFCDKFKEMILKYED
jgi:hypothetical protein